MHGGGTRLFTLSNDRNEYKKMVRTLSGENSKSNMSPDVTNSTLLDFAKEKLRSEDAVTLIHDPSDIRKPYSTDLENIGYVRSLDNKIIRGYSTHNIIALPSKSKIVTLLSNKTYSNRADHFLSQETISKLESGTDFDGRESAQKIYESGNYFNKKTISKEEISRVSQSLKQSNPAIKISHVLDREFDDDDYIDLISNILEDEFVIRSKKSRCLDDVDENGKKVRLIVSSFDNSHQLPFQKLSIKKTVIQDGKILLEWKIYGKIYAVKITILDRSGNNVFNESMLLLTNKELLSFDDAYAVYKEYLKRARIEYVFKFLKEGLGWEEMQVREFKAIENLISLCFYVAAYLYDIGDKEAYDDYAVMLSELGDGKGIISRHFILKGIHVVSNYYKYQYHMEKKKVSKERQDAIKELCFIEL
jgi:hypothetical protein